MSDDVVLEEIEDETEAEREARLAEEQLQAWVAEDRKTIDLICDKMLIIIDELSDVNLYPYQSVVARRMIESLIIGDGATITALFARQSGKSEMVSNTIAACMVMLPILSKVFPTLLEKFSRGFWVGCFAPTDEQAEIVYSRIVSRLTSEHAQAFFADPDINEKVTKGFGNTMHLRNGSLVRRQTAHPRSNIEGRTYHLMLVDECQDADSRVINKSIAPMGASTNATMVFIGTPSYTKGEFYDQIQKNKRAATARGGRQNHFEADWRVVVKYNKNYGQWVRKEMDRLGEDADEFRLAYRLHWLLDKGMFTTQSRIEELGDKSMEVQKFWYKTPVVVGIDPARKQDSTIVTVTWVDWDHPDEFGLMEHRILNWLDLGGISEWETQYAMIVDFLSAYNVFAIGVDEGGLGDPVIQRLRVLMPRTEIIGVQSDRATQSKRWKHLMTLMDRGKIGWPAHAKTRRLKVYNRFIQQMGDLELHFEGPYVLASAPKSADAHDDYCDSLAISCIIAADYQVPEVEVSDNPFYKRR